METTKKNGIMTIPNLLSLFRLCLIPLIIWMYDAKGNNHDALLLLLLSGLTDVADGIIARRCGMVSDFGKVFDPIADKLTQLAMLFCLFRRFPRMLIPFVVLTVKEAVAAVLGLITVKKTDSVPSAVWHGKLTTLFLYATIGLHLIWSGIPHIVSDACIALCTGMMLVSAVLYGIKNVRAIQKHSQTV